MLILSGTEINIIMYIIHCYQFILTFKMVHFMLDFMGTEGNWMKYHDYEREVKYCDPNSEYTFSHT